MSILGLFKFDEEELEAAAFLNTFSIFNTEYYRQRAGLTSHANAALHYLQEGWRNGLEPSPSFRGDFLHPYYSACGYDGPPAFTWAELTLLGGNPLAFNEPAAKEAAARIRDIPLFNAEYYARRLPAELDPALHYVIIGERLGWRPSEHFDPGIYAEFYPDVVEAGVSQLMHYWQNGRKENRITIAATDRLEFPPLRKGDDRPVVLVVSHEASRTGAPILGWNIIKNLSKDYRIVSLLLRKGVIEKEFGAISTVQIGPLMEGDLHSLHISKIIARIAKEYNPIYAITNSIETHAVVPPLALQGIPSIALVHEFMSYTGDADEKMYNVFKWAPKVVFPAQIVAQSAFDNFARLEYRKGITISAQGQAELPTASISDAVAERHDCAKRLRDRMRPPGTEDAFLVLGAGTVQYRKGIDLFVATAASVRRMHSQIPIRFVWIGDGFDPKRDLAFSAYLADQIRRSELGSSFTMLDAVSDLGPAYEAADAFFMSSRLDPQPNVGIDALIRGIPTICFEGACGTGEILIADVATQHLVVPYLDVQQAADLILELASDAKGNQKLRHEIERVGRKAFDMGRYASMLDDFGRVAAQQESKADVLELANSAVLDPDMLCDPGDLIDDDEELARYAMRQWSLWNMLDASPVSPLMRRPMKGFNPQAYASAHLDINSSVDVNPVLHWLRNGRTSGPWQHEVYTASSSIEYSQSMHQFKIALHGHFYYTDDAYDLATRLSQNLLTCDLFLTTGSETDRDFLQEIFYRHNGFVDVRIVPNRGRDIGPFLTELALELSGDEYDLIGHVHGKKTKVVGGGIGDHWRTFLWENLIGGQYPMLDMAAAVFAGNAETGLLIAEDPHLVGWDENLGVASELAERMGLSLPLDTYFDFPLGTMFWARPSALRPLFDLRLNWDDYPMEPVPYDGTVLHAIERLIPFVVRHGGYRMAGLHVAGTNW